MAHFSDRPRDEDITPMDTNNTPQVDIQGPITRTCAQQLNLQVISFLRNYFCAFESSMLSNNLIVLKNEGEDQQGRGKDLGVVEDQRGRPDQDGSPNRFDFVLVSDSRNSPYQNGRPCRIRSRIWMFFIWMER
jgi:hypothetical protein